MIAIDTNVLIRFITCDDSVQASQANRIIRNKSIFISKTVLLESEWVLRAAYKLKPNLIYKALISLLGLPNITIEDPFNVWNALNWYTKGLDFADALHLASRQHANEFMTFDHKLRKKAMQLKICNLTSN